VAQGLTFQPQDHADLVFEGFRSTLYWVSTTQERKKERKNKRHEGGPEALQNKINEILGSKLDD